ncbi:MAG: Exodeoxyribonuclease 7 large subunit [Candidatus Saccharibacteria bacterium]|nr:Exodeoxyribonuclease 7 large subunit [Candidatus Saccharibacteria bacterium]
MNPQELILSVTDFVALLNQTLEFAYPNVVITGELANFRVSKNRWVYFDLKDEFSSVKFFGTVYQLPGPLEDGLLLQVRAQPRLHPQYGFSLTIQNIQLAGEGSLKRAALLLQAKLTVEGLFDEDRKRRLPYPPQSIGLITSGESAAYADFTKIMNARWGGVEIQLADVQVQGEVAPEQIVRAIEFFNQHADGPDVLVLTRGGGSAEDLAAFSTEQVTRAIAGSRIPTIVAIGHEVDLSLAELAADKRASTPSNAAELLVPDKKHELAQLSQALQNLHHYLRHSAELRLQSLAQDKQRLSEAIQSLLSDRVDEIDYKKRLLLALSPREALKRGFAIVRKNGQLVRSAKVLRVGNSFGIEFSDGEVRALVDK